MNEVEKRTVEWCRQQISMFKATLKPFEDGTIRWREYKGSAWRDITAEQSAILQRQIEELERLISAYEARDAQRTQGARPT